MELCFAVSLDSSGRIRVNLTLDGVMSSTKRSTIIGSSSEDPGLVYHSVDYLLRQNTQLKVSVLQIYYDRIQDLFQVSPTISDHNHQL
jgi:hypothetical protein